jgi:hypothetical protein
LGEVSLEAFVSNDEIKPVMSQAAPVVVRELVESRKEGSKVSIGTFDEAESTQIGLGHVTAAFLELPWIGVVTSMVGLVFLVEADNIVHGMSDSGKDKVVTFLSSGDAQELVIVGMFAQYRFAVVVLTQFSADGGTGSVGEFHEQVLVSVTNDHVLQASRAAQTGLLGLAT